MSKLTGAKAEMLAAILRTFTKSERRAVLDALHDNLGVKTVQLKMGHKAMADGDKAMGKTGRDRVLKLRGALDGTLADSLVAIAATRTKEAIEPDAVYSAAEAAYLLGLTTDTIHRWSREGKLKSTSPGGRRRFIRGRDLLEMCS